MHPNGKNDLFFYTYQGQEYCSTSCQFEQDGTFKIAVTFENATIEVDIVPQNTTTKQLQRSVIEQTLLAKASPPMIIPPREGLTTLDGLCCDWDINPNETNVEFIKRSSSLMNGDEPISTFFKSPCSELTLNEYIEGNKIPPSPYISIPEIDKEIVKYIMVTDEKILDQEGLVYDQLSRNAGFYVNEYGHSMLRTKIILPEQYQKKTVDPAEQQLEWFRQLGLEDLNASILKNRKYMWFKVGERSVAVGSVNGSAYYEKFLLDYSKKRPDIISPFYSDRAWVLFHFGSGNKRDAWLDHYQKVMEASPPRSFGAVKYLMTTELMNNDQAYKDIVNDESDVVEQRWSYYDDMICRYKLLKEHNFKKYDGSIKPPKLPKKKASRKRTPRPTPPKAENGRLVLKFSKEYFETCKKRKYSEDSLSWTDVHDPYADEDEDKW